MLWNVKVIIHHYTLGFSNHFLTVGDSAEGCNLEKANINDTYIISTDVSK